MIVLVAGLALFLGIHLAAISRGDPGRLVLRLGGPAMQ